MYFFCLASRLILDEWNYMWMHREHAVTSLVWLVHVGSIILPWKLAFLEVVLLRCGGLTVCSWVEPHQPRANLDRNCEIIVAACGSHWSNSPWRQTLKASLGNLGHPQNRVSHVQMTSAVIPNRSQPDGLKPLKPSQATIAMVPLWPQPLGHGCCPVRKLAALCTRQGRTPVEMLFLCRLAKMLSSMLVWLVLIGIVLYNK